MLRRASSFLVLSILILADSLAADRDPPTSGQAPAEDPIVARIAGDHVNLRVGPRVDSRAVSQLDDGAVLIVVERAGEWLGVRVPQGFPAAVAAEFAEEVGPDAVRVAATNVNLRVHPPQDGGPPGAPFRDRPAKGSLLTKLSREGDWYWVLAPEEIRAFVHTRYVKEVGPLSANGEGVEAARASRARQTEMLSAARRSQISEAAGSVLRGVLGEVQEQLHRRRLEASTDKAPVVALADRLDQEVEKAALAPVRVLAIAKALREDLEAEIALTVARQDAEVARLRGRKDVTVPTPAQRIESVDLLGVIRWEATPGWRDGGVHLLWVDDVPRYALRRTTGGELPHPDLKAHADGKPRRIQGSQPGDRLFGLPAVDVRTIRIP